MYSVCYHLHCQLYNNKCQTSTLLRIGVRIFVWMSELGNGSSAYDIMMCLRWFIWVIFVSLSCFRVE